MAAVHGQQKIKVLLKTTRKHMRKVAKIQFQKDLCLKEQYFTTVQVATNKKLK